MNYPLLLRVEIIIRKKPTTKNLGSLKNADDYNQCNQECDTKYYLRKQNMNINTYNVGYWSEMGSDKIGTVLILGKLYKEMVLICLVKN